MSEVPQKSPGHLPVKTAAKNNHSSSSRFLHCPVSAGCTQKSQRGTEREDEEEEEEEEGGDGVMG